MQRERSDPMLNDRADVALGIKQRAGDRGHRHEHKQGSRGKNSGPDTFRPSSDYKRDRQRANQDDRWSQQRGVIKEETRDAIAHEAFDTDAVAAGFYGRFNVERRS